jgi:hypothetical protein
MLHFKSKWLALLSLAVATSGVALAQSADNQALIDLLIKKGVLSDQEAKDITAQIAKDQSSQDVETNNDGFLQKLTLSGRFQVQYAGIGTAINGNPVNPVSTEHFFLRRIYIGVNAQFGDGFSGVVTYDLANSSFDKALLEWKQSPLFVVDLGLTKAPFGYEENQSSGNLLAIERSTITRYIDEPNNGRRIGAASYRDGLFVSGTYEGFFYQLAATDPERNEYSGDSTNTAVLVNGLGGVGSTGGATTNSFAVYGNVGYGMAFGKGTPYNGSFKVGYEAGFDPDQGGTAALGLGHGQNISLSGGFGDLTVGGFRLVGEYETADVDSGVAVNKPANISGWWIQPSYRFTKEWEAVLQYSYINSDGRGVALSDVIRSAPSGGTMNTAAETYIGFNYYIKGNDVKLQTGYIHGESNNTVTGAYAHASTDGIRSQFQIQF